MMTPHMTFAAAAAEGGTSASSTPFARNAGPAEGTGLVSSASTASGQHPKPAAVDGRAGATPAPARRPAIFPLSPRFTWLVDEEPATFEVCVTVEGGKVAVVARDALAAAGVDLGTYAADPDCTVTPYSSHADAATWSFDLIADILTVVDDAPQPAAFLRWLEQRMHELAAFGIHRLERADPQRRYTEDEDGELRKAPDFFSVREAARILNRDPVISTGQTRLFQYLAAIGWVHRAGNAWRPAFGIPARGLLAVQDTAERHYSRDEPYPQITLTVAGLHELHRRLGGTAELDLTPHPTLSIEE